MSSVVSAHGARWITGVLGCISSRVRVLIFAAALATLSVMLLSLVPTTASVPDRAWSMPFFALVIAFSISEAAALHVEIRKESHSLSLSLIPLMYGALYVSPGQLMVAYLLGGTPVLLWIRKSDALKALWNSCLFLAEAALVVLIIRSLLGDELPDTALEWLVPLGAVLAAELMSLLAVPLVIMAVDAKFRPNLFADVGRSQIMAALAGSFTVTAISAATGDVYMILYSLVTVIGIGALLQSTGHLSQRFQDLQQLHSFTRALTNERGARTLDTGLHSLVEIMRTRSAGLVTVGLDDGTSYVRALVDDTFADLDLGETADAFVELVEPGSVAQLTSSSRDPQVRALLRTLKAEKILAARVLGEVDRHAVLFISDRLGMRDDFTADELRLFGSLADTLSARLSNDYLVEQLEVQAQHDALTGLANRLSFEIAITSILAQPDQHGAVLMVDLDRFKEINDSLGHETGDRLLIEIGERLRSCAKSNDLVARFGGDEFAMLLIGRSGDGLGDLTCRVSDIHARLAQKVELDGITFEIGASVGVVEWPDQGADSVNLLKRADTAMYQAKRNQLGVVWYTPELDADAPRRLDLYLSARSALENGDIYANLQPKVSLRDGRITGVEALARWTHPAHGPISPSEFVPLVEQAGLIGRLTRFMIKSAAESAAILRDAGFDVPVSVNLTPRDLLDPALPADIESTVADAGVDASSLLVEITEGSMEVDFDSSVSVLNRIRSLGVQVAIDDFGTGYSSLQHLHRLPVDQLKIDRSFVTRLESDTSATAIVRASINLANDLGLTTVAEGVEDVHALRVVVALGCEEIQGFMVSRPQPIHDVLRWAQDWDPAWLLDRIAESGLPTSSTGAASEALHGDRNVLARAGERRWR